MKIELQLIQQKDKESDRLVHNKSILLSFYEEEIVISLKTISKVIPQGNIVQEKIEEIGVLEKENVKCFTDIFK